MAGRTPGAPVPSWVTFRREARLLHLLATPSITAAPYCYCISPTTKPRQAELNRISAGGAFLRSDRDRSAAASLAAPPPPPSADGSGSSADVAAWEAAVYRARIAVEEQGVAAMNLELFQRFGPDAWKAHVIELDQLQARGRALPRAIAHAHVLMHMCLICVDNRCKESGWGRGYHSTRVDYRLSAHPCSPSLFMCRLLSAAAPPAWLPAWTP